MNDRRCPPRDEVVAALRARSAPGWDAISDTVIESVRSASRPGRLLRVTSPAPRVPGVLTIRDHALRALLARALRADAHVDPARVDLEIEGQELTAVRVSRRTAAADARTEPLTVADHVRRVVLRVVRDVLGEAQHNLLIHTIDVGADPDDRRVT